MRRLPFLLAGIILVLLGTARVWGSARSAAPDPEAISWQGLASPLEAPPLYNWRVCADLGFGPVPGVSGSRQRFRMCHTGGWAMQAYCVQLNRPAPAVGTICSRNGDTFWCGSAVQSLRTYRVLQTPTPSPSPSPTGTPTPSPTPTTSPSPTPTTPAPTPTPRGRAGGSGLLVGYLQAIMKAGARAIGVLLSPGHSPNPSPPTSETVDPPAAGLSPGFYGIDFSNREQSVRILIFPPDKKVNKGKPIIISFIPGRKCKFGDHHGCVNSYSVGASEVTFVTVHSGVGGEAEPFRLAMEGSGVFGAAYPLGKVQANLQALDGAKVVLTQGKKRIEGFRLAATTRVEPKWVNEYFKAPVEGAASFAAAIDPGFRAAVPTTAPQLIFETCGWRVRGERSAGRLPSTSASVYLGVIEKEP
jgi:hypothetical protein